MSDELQVPEGQAADSLLFGSYERSLDAKGRFNVPFRFRAKEAGKEDEPVRFMITEDAQGVVSLMTRDNYETSLRSALKLRRGREQWHFVRWLATHSQPVQLDGQGRVAIPQKYLERIGAKKRLLVVGVGKRMELWDPARITSVQTATGDPAEEFFDVFYQDELD